MESQRAQMRLGLASNFYLQMLDYLNKTGHQENLIFTTTHVAFPKGQSSPTHNRCQQYKVSRIFISSDL